MPPANKYILLPSGYTVRLSRGEDGYILASCPQLPGCRAQGRDHLEALGNIADAVTGYIALLDEESQVVPSFTVSTSTDVEYVFRTTSADVDELVWEPA